MMDGPILQYIYDIAIDGWAHYNHIYIIVLMTDGPIIVIYI